MSFIKRANCLYFLVEQIPIMGSTDSMQLCLDVTFNDCSDLYLINSNDPMVEHTNVNLHCITPQQLKLFLTLTRQAQQIVQVVWKFRYNEQDRAVYKIIKIMEDGVICLCNSAQPNSDNIRHFKWNKMEATEGLVFVQN